MSLPNHSSPAAGRDLRADLHAALAQIETLPIARAWRPAFLTPLSALPQPRRTPLADRRGPRPPVAPFGGQELTLAGAVRGLAAGALTVTALLERMLAVIDRRRPAANVFACVAPAAELAALGRELDAELRAGVCRGMLHGIPLAVKDVFDVAGMPNPGGADAVSVRLLKAAGAVILGKTHAHELTQGGAAMAVAGGMSLGALGAAAGASLRVPAALCGIVGCKPTFGLAPSAGLAMLSWSLDHVGHMAATVEDAALLLDVLDPAPHVRCSQALHKDMRRVRIGLPPAALEGAEAGVAGALRAAAAALAGAGAEVSEIETPAAEDFDLAVSLELIVSRAEAAAHHTAGAASPPDEAAGVSAVHYLQAQRAREDLRWRMLRLFDRFDALLLPTTRAAGRAAGRAAAPDREEFDALFPVPARSWAQNCTLWSLIGFPALTLPCGRTSDGFPVGAQLVAAPYEDARLLAIAAALELALSRG